jgi:hypothetical protein
MMFPELAEMSAVDHSITLIVTQYWQWNLYLRVYLFGAHRTGTQQKANRISKHGMRGTVTYFRASLIPHEYQDTVDHVSQPQRPGKPRTPGGVQRGRRSSEHCRL